MAEATKQVTQFPSQSVDDATKSSMDYGMEVARGIQNEWFKNHPVQEGLYKIKETFTS